MPMSIEQILHEAKKMKVGDRQSFVCDHVPSSLELRHLAIDVAKHHKSTPAIDWTGGLDIIINLPVPRNK